MLAALNLGAVLTGVGAGGLTASLLALLVSGVLTLLGLDSGPDVGLAFGVFAGLGVGGWVAGTRSTHSHRFHGMVTGLVIAFLILVIARFGGSPAPTGTVVWLAVLATVIAGVAGWLAGRRRDRRG